MRNKSHVKHLLFLSALCLLGGCNPFAAFAPDSAQIIESGWAKPAAKSEREDPLYCYETLGERVCYRHPRKGSHNTLSGYYGPEPH